MLGYCTKYGDNAADLQPLLHLYKTEVYEYAHELGIPEPIIKKEPSAGLNRIRVSGGIEPVPFDERAYQLAQARSADMASFRYLDYTNPETGSSAESMREELRIEHGDVIIERAYGQWNGYTFGIEKQAIDAWISDEGNRDRLFSPIDGGAVACSHGYCSFIGITRQPDALPAPDTPLFIKEEIPGTINASTAAG